MKLTKKIMVIIMTVMLLGSLSACKDSSSPKGSIDTYMKNLKNLNSSNYVNWVNENLDNPYVEAGLDLSQLKQGQIDYFIKCLSMMEYEIVNIDETNKIAEVKVSYVDSSEYVTNIFAEILAYAFSQDYSEEGENQIYLDVMNAIEQYQFVDDTLYFSFTADNEIENVSSNIFDVLTAGFYKIMLGDAEEYESQQAKYTAEELLNNLEINYEVEDENNIFVTITNNNEVAVYPVINFCFVDADGNEIIRSQASIEALPAGMTNYTYAYNELGSEGVVDFNLEMEIAYYENEDISFYDESLIPYEIKQEDDMVSIYFTNNTEETINICGGYLVYNAEGKIMMSNDIGIYYLAAGESDCTWFYLNSSYDENADAWIIEPYERIEIYPIAHNDASYIWVN